VAGLYDNVQENIAIQNRLNMGSGHGWSGAYYVVWNCKGELICQSPPTAQNFAFGQEGKIAWGHFARKSGDRSKYKIRPGQFNSNGRRVHPASLYLQQIEERLGRSMLRNLADH